MKLSFSLLFSFLFFCFLFLFSCKKTVEEPAPTPVNNYVNARDYRRLVLEIVSEKGMSLQSGTITYIRKFLEARLDKPGGIEIVQKEISSGSKAVYSLEELRALEKVNRGAQNSGETATIYAFIADAGYSENQAVLGIAYGGSALVIFEKVIRQYSGGFGQPALQTIESSVMAHELGHLMGLVNNGTEMVVGHQDEQNGKHCNNKNCLMYYATETRDFVTNLFGGSIPDLDAACSNDLQKERSR